MFMSKVVLKNLFQKYVTRPHPFVRREQPKGARGMFTFDADACIQCGLCARNCPTSCIQLDPEKGEWKRSIMACLYCGVCADVCPKKCITLTNVYRGPVTKEEYLVFKTKPKAGRKPKVEAEAKGAEAATEQQTAKGAEVTTEQQTAKGAEVTTEQQTAKGAEEEAPRPDGE